MRANRFTRTIEALDEMSRQLATPLAIVGGMAGLHHGTGVTTVDIDVVIAGDRSDELADQAEKRGWNCRNRSPRGWHVLENPDPEGSVTVEVIPAGEKSPRDPEEAPPVPTAEALGVTAGVGYAELAPWVLMKLVAARDKDRYHLTELGKHLDEPQLATIVQHLRTHAPQYLPEFQRLYQAAQDEDIRNW